MNPTERNFFDRINYAIRNTEASLVNLLSAVAPWAAPVAPAYTSYDHMTNSLGYPPLVAIFVAAVVEILGFSAINTTIGFWTFNKRANRGRVADYRKAPVWIAIAAFVSYLAVVITINIVLDAANVLRTAGAQALSVMSLEDWVKVASRGLLVLLSIPAGVILAVRTQHKETLDAMDEELYEKRTPRLDRESSVESSISKAKRRFIEDLRSGRLQSLMDERGVPLEPEHVAELYKVSRRTAYRWLSEYKERT